MDVLKNLSQTERGVAVIVKSLVCFLLLAVMYPVQAQNKPVIRGVVVDSVKKEKYPLSISLYINRIRYLLHIRFPIKTGLSY